MKNRLIIYCLLFISSGLLMAQTEAGSVFLGGSSSFGSGFSNSQIKMNGSTVDDSERTDFDLNFSPDIQYFIIDNLAVGLSLSTSFNHFSTNNFKSTNTSLGIGPSVTYLFGSKNYKPFLHGGATFSNGWSKSNNETSTNTFSRSSFGYNVGGGMAVFFNERFACNMGLHFGQSRLEVSDDEVYINNGVYARVGFLIKLR